MTTTEARATVAVHAFDPISEAGVGSQLRYRPEVRVVEATARADVAVVVVDRVDEQALRAVRAAQRGGAKVVAVAAQLEGRDVLAAVEAGCAGLLRRIEVTPERLVAAVRSAAAGEGTLPPDLLGRLLEQVGRLQRGTQTSGELTMGTLTRREVQVLRLAADGHATDEIAGRLNYSERTVKNVIHDVVTRLNLRNRSHAVAFALREGLI